MSGTPIAAAADALRGDTPAHRATPPRLPGSARHLEPIAEPFLPDVQGHQPSRAATSAATRGIRASGSATWCTPQKGSGAEAPPDGSGNLCQHLPGVADDFGGAPELGRDSGHPAVEGNNRSLATGLHLVGVSDEGLDLNVAVHLVGLGEAHREVPRSAGHQRLGDDRYTRNAHTTQAQICADRGYSSTTDPRATRALEWREAEARRRALLEGAETLADMAARLHAAGEIGAEMAVSLGAEVR